VGKTFATSELDRPGFPAAQGLRRSRIASFDTTAYGRRLELWGKVTRFGYLRVGKNFSYIRLCCRLRAGCWGGRTDRLDVPIYCKHWRWLL